jgi:hypothetical protein
MSRLERLECDSVDLTSRILSARLAAVRPPLQELRVRATALWLPSSAFRLPSLPEFGSDMLEYFERSGHAELSRDALADLARRKSLHSLRFAPLYPHSYISGSTVWQAFQGPPHIGTKTAPLFRSLRSLCVEADWEAIELLLEAMPLPSSSSSVRELDFTLPLFTGGGPASFAVFAAFTQHLHMLRLRISHVVALQGADILSAVHRPASPLRELSLQSCEDEPLVFVGFDDALFETLVAALPQLEVLRLEGCGSLIPAVFRIAGACCRALRELALHQVLESGQLGVMRSDAFPVLFPELRQLELTSPQPSEPYWRLTIDFLHRNW